MAAAATAPPIVLLPGRLTSWKGQAVLIEALARLARRDICCVLVGSDQGRKPIPPALIRQAADASALPTGCAWPASATICRRR